MKGEQQIAEIALWINHDGRHAVNGCFFDERDAQFGLLAACHAYDHCVGDEILGAIDYQVVL